MSIAFPRLDWGSIAPLLVLVGGTLAFMAADLVLPRERRGERTGLAVAVLLASLAATAAAWNGGEVRMGSLGTIVLWRSGWEATFAGHATADGFALLTTAIFLVTALLTVLLSGFYLVREGTERADYLTLILFATAGMVVLATGIDLITIFLGLEVMSLAVYALAGFHRDDERSGEAALKYFLMGAFASGFFLYGIAFVYGACGSTSLAAIGDTLGRGAPASGRTIALVGLAFLLAGFGFKVAAVPFHLWTPDVYEGAPTTVTAFMSVAVKAAAFAALARVLRVAFAPVAADWTWLVWGLAALSMTIGNLAALQQSSLKRMLAYSSIAHAGYLLVGLVADPREGTAGIAFYLCTYLFANLGAFAVLVAMGEKGERNLTLEGCAGAAWRHPRLALAMAVFMLSLAGVPPTAGFMGKFYLFGAAVRANYVGLAVLGVLTSAISLGYYLNVVVKMYMREPAPAEAPVARPSRAVAFVLAVALIGTLLFGILPSALMIRAEQAALALM